jgi:hypothetical protein
VGGGWQSCCFSSKIPWWKKKVWDSALPWCTSQFYGAKVWGEVFTHFHPVTVNTINIDWLVCRKNSLWIIPWCQRKWCACSWLCSSLVSPLFASVSLGFLCMAHAIFLENLYNHR